QERMGPAVPPRGFLQGSVKVIRTAKGASVQIYAPYAYPLEKSTRWYGWPHAFLSVALENLGLIGRHSRGGGAGQKPRPKPAAGSWRGKVAAWFNKFTSFHGP